MSKFRFVSANYDSSTSVHACVRGRMTIDGGQKVATGEHRDKFAASPFKAAQHAVFQLTGLRPDISGSICTVGGGREKCAAEVHLTVKKNRQRIVGKAE